MTSARTRTLALVTLVVVFLAGAAAGVGAAPLLHPPPRAGQLPEALEELHLTRVQREEARRIIDSHGPEVERVMGDALPRLRTVQDQVRREIRDILTEDQRRQLDAIEAKQPIPPPPPPRPRPPD